MFFFNLQVATLNFGWQIKTPFFFGWKAYHIKTNPWRTSQVKLRWRWKQPRFRFRRVWSDLKLKSWKIHDLRRLTHWLIFQRFLGFLEWLDCKSEFSHHCETVGAIFVEVEGIKHIGLQNTPHTWQVDDLMNVIGYFFNLRGSWKGRKLER